ncbi:MAG: hypothetical protein LKJ47_00315 [Bifidobacteriaceae bacterium]|nr:hypothetical protein [Bifidobacteriaceae bacterium]
MTIKTRLAVHSLEISNDTSLDNIRHFLNSFRKETELSFSAEQFRENAPVVPLAYIRSERQNGLSEIRPQKLHVIDDLPQKYWWNQKTTQQRLLSNRQLPFLLLRYEEFTAKDHTENSGIAPFPIPCSAGDVMSLDSIKHYGAFQQPNGLKSNSFAVIEAVTGIVFPLSPGAEIRICDRYFPQRIESVNVYPAEWERRARQSIRQSKYRTQKTEPKQVEADWGYGFDESAALSKVTELEHTLESLISDDGSADYLEVQEIIRKQAATSELLDCKKGLE